MAAPAGLRSQRRTQRSGPQDGLEHTDRRSRFREAHNKVATLRRLKRELHKLALIHHPDHCLAATWYLLRLDGDVAVRFLQGQRIIRGGRSQIGEEAESELAVVRNRI